MNISDYKKTCGLEIKEANLLVSFAIGQPLEFILANPLLELKKNQILKLDKLATRRKNHEPIAHLTGRQGFYGLDLAVNRHTLVPRPETELLVDEALGYLASQPKKNNLFVADIGTGSGCIAIAIAKELATKKLTGKLIATDKSARALDIARKNALTHGLDDIIFMRGDLLSPIKQNFNLAGQDCLIAANLPYLTPQQVAASPSISREPRGALISGPDGLSHYRRLFGQVKNIDFQSCRLLCEIDETQTSGISALVKKKLPGWQLAFKQDLGGYDRLAIITWNG